MHWGTSGTIHGKTVWSIQNKNCQDHLPGLSFNYVMKTLLSSRIHIKPGLWLRLDYKGGEDLLILCLLSDEPSKNSDK
ncbi:hypothetical protein Y1Q_0001811 [Alligator mississippiensis]|uniref:Uncharacterized protein n=1 Tax=Alligator mississippiensis TaxID=8496 RepID=A0A151MKY5_ALLMI|nr:hypothetical protein Y1Q_0001811 [Alligator mississippiensis]